MLRISEDLWQAPLQTCGSAEDSRRIAQESRDQVDLMLGMIGITRNRNNYSSGNKNKCSSRNKNNYSSGKSNSGLTKDDKDYLMGVIKSMQEVIEIQNSIIKNNQINSVIDAEPIDITENVIDVELIEITDNEETVIEEKESKIELTNDNIEILTKEIIKGTRNIINNFVKNLNK